ncbi:winged helix-turn-helix transcriptional regulator [Brevibacillus fluminis]|uniref:winged helix-turn-helix transcriptional regulator n=1 Tax=Brevibacillus fluminis TaxID=511487 RepID=UPI003F8A9ECA
MQKKKYYCPVEVTVDAMGGKWKSRLMWHLGHKPYRYGELKRLIPEITGKMLAQALRELEADGLIKRTEQSGKIVTVEYSLTSYGSSLTPILQLMSEWGRAHLRQLQEDAQAQAGTTPS